MSKKVQCQSCKFSDCEKCITKEKGFCKKKKINIKLSKRRICQNYEENYRFSVEKS